jgi:NAD+ kinase
VSAMVIQRIVVVTKRPSTEIKELSKHFEIGDKGELCVAIGGDGTFLEAARKVDCPILLIRSGETNSLGFHATANLQELPKIIERLNKGDYYVEKYRKLRITFRGNSFEAVNDAVLFRENLAIHFKANYFDGGGSLEPLYPSIVRGDGIIISREIGSTAYNYLAHGPIILDKDIAVVTPICANYRFSIVSDHDFSIELLKNRGFLNCDGMKVGELDVNDTFYVSRSDKSVQIVRFKGSESFSGKLSRLIDF